MPNSITIPNTFVDDTDALAADVNANFSAVATFLNSTKLNDDNLKTGGVGTASIADGAITQAKRASLGQQLSSGSGTFTSTSNSFTDVTNLSVTLTTTGRPVALLLVSSDNDCYVGAGGAGVGASADLAFLRSSTRIAVHTIYDEGGLIRLPGSAFQAVDTGASAGSTTYKVQVKYTGGIGGNIAVTNLKLLAYEL
jgi:hypothetical protein